MQTWLLAARIISKPEVKFTPSQVALANNFRQRADSIIPPPSLLNAADVRAIRNGDDLAHLVHLLAYLNGFQSEPLCCSLARMRALDWERERERVLVGPSGSLQPGDQIKKLNSRRDNRKEVSFPRSTIFPPQQFQFKSHARIKSMPATCCVATLACFSERVIEIARKVSLSLCTSWPSTSFLSEIYLKVCIVVKKLLFTNISSAAGGNGSLSAQLSRSAWQVSCTFKELAH